jgi:hypothetical protein
MATRRKKIGDSILSAMQIGTDAWKMLQDQKQSKALERYRNAQAAHIERQGGFLDMLAKTYDEDVPLQTSQSQNLVRSLPSPPPQLSHGDMISRQDPRHGLPPLPTRGAPAAASPTEQPEERQQYRFIPSGSPDAMKVVGDGTSMVDGLSQSAFGGGDLPTFRAGTDVDLRKDFQLPPQYDERNDQRRMFATLGGVSNVEGVFPRDETPEWKIQFPFIEALSTGFANMFTTSPTKMDYTDRLGNNKTTYQNLDLLVNSGVAKGLFRIPEVRSMLEGMGISESNFLSSSELNTKALLEGTTSDQIVQSESNRAMDPHNPLQQAIVNHPFGGMEISEGPLGNIITTATIPEFDRRVLQNMIPLSNVVKKLVFLLDCLALVRP